MSQDGETLIPEVDRTNLMCTIKSDTLNYLLGGEVDWPTCYIHDQEIDDEGFSIAGNSNSSIKGFTILNNKLVKFLPENIVESFPELFKYVVWNCSIKTVNGKHFKGLNKLQYLGLHNNEIESIDGDSFKDLTKLLALNLSQNKIKMIDTKWFQSFITLRVCNYGDNQIEFLDEKVFDNLKNIEEIGLRNNKLSMVPENLFKNNLKLEKIYLDENKIQKIGSTMFDHLKNLTWVDLDNNVCTNYFYGKSQFDRMKKDLSRNCTSPV